MSRDTWAEARSKITVSEIIDSVQPWLEETDGITISGGEPFEQPEALMELLEGFRIAADTSVIAYSGFPLEQLTEQHPSILEQIDLLISEPFDSTKAVSAPLFGSANQRAICLTKRGAEIWQKAEADWRERGGRLDLITEADGLIWVAGVPGPGDLERLGTRLRSAGITPLTSAGRLGVST
jgi:anaerobic ribonucleoside-triphosphate reductase activating protein